MIYQEVPQPGHPRGTTRSAAEYGYRGGVILPSSGILRVRVTPTETAVDYLQTKLGSASPAVESHHYVLRAN